MALRVGILCATIVLVSATRAAGTMTVFSFEKQNVTLNAIVSGHDGYLWVTQLDGYVARLTTAGAFKGAIPTPNASENSDSIVAGRDGNIWFSEWDKKLTRLGRITPRGDLTEYVLPGVINPIALVATPEGIVYNGDLNNTLGRISYAGKHSAINFTTKIHINALAYDSNGTLWYAGCTGVGYLTRRHVSRDYYVEGGCNGIAGVAVTPNGVTWFSAAGYIGYIDAVRKMRLFKPLYAPTSMAAAPDGSLWFANSQGNLIARITQQGSVTRFRTTFGESPGAMAVGPDGNLWVCGADRLLRITL